MASYVLPTRAFASLNLGSRSWHETLYAAQNSHPALGLFSSTLAPSIPDLFCVTSPSIYLWASPTAFLLLLSSSLVLFVVINIGRLVLRSFIPISSSIFFLRLRTVCVVGCSYRCYFNSLPPSLKALAQLLAVVPLFPFHDVSPRDGYA